MPRFGYLGHRNNCLPQFIAFIVLLRLVFCLQVVPLTVAYLLQRLRPHSYLALFIIPIVFLILHHPHLYLLPTVFVRPLEVRKAGIRLAHFP